MGAVFTLHASQMMQLEHETQENPDQMSDSYQDEEINIKSDEEDTDVENLTYYPNLRCSPRPYKPPVRFGAMLTLQARMGIEDDLTPLTLHEAMPLPDKVDGNMR